MKGLVADATVYKVSRIPLKFFDIVFYRGFLLSDSVVANVTLLISFLFFFYLLLSRVIYDFITWRRLT